MYTPASGLGGVAGVVDGVVVAGRRQRGAVGPFGRGIVGGGRTAVVAVVAAAGGEGERRDRQERGQWASGCGHTVSLGIVAGGGRGGGGGEAGGGGAGGGGRGRVCRR